MIAVAATATIHIARSHTVSTFARHDFMLAWPGDVMPVMRKWMVLNAIPSRMSFLR